MTSIKATPETVLTGRTVGTSGQAQCDYCHEPLREGDSVGIYAYQMVDWSEPTWDVPRLACADCRRSELGTPTLGAAEVLAHARLGVTSDVATQSAQLTVRDPTIVVVSPPATGSNP